MVLTNTIRGIVKRNPNLKLKLKKANFKLSPFQYVYQTFVLTIMSYLALIFVAYMFFKNDLMNFLLVILGISILVPFIYGFWFRSVDVYIRKEARLIDGDLLFVSEYLLVSLESGLPLGNAIENLSKVNRPGGIFFKRVFTEFKTGKSFDDALVEGINFSPSKNLKLLLKRLKDSMTVGVDLRVVLETFIQDSSDRKIMEIKGFAKKLNPIIMMYLLLGIVLPSLGVTFFILAAAMLNITPAFLKLILMFIFLIMFGFQYFSYSLFRFNKSTI